MNTSNGDGGGVILNGHHSTLSDARSNSNAAAAAAAIMGKLTAGDNNAISNNNNNVTVNGQKTQTDGRASGGVTGSGGRRGDPRYLDVIRERPIRVTVKVLVPVREHPKFNFVGKLLGPKGNSMKRLQEETLTKMAVLGRGSMRDKQKEEELRASGDPKYVHLLEDLHVEITAFASPAEAHARIAYALAEVRRYLVPDNNDDIRKEQIREMELISDPQAAGGAAQTPEGGGAGAAGERPPPALTPPELLSPEGPDCRGTVVGPAPPGPALPPGLRGRVPPPHPRLLPAHAARGLPPLVRKLPAAMPPPVPPPPAKRRVLSILDKAKLALDHSYGLHEDDPRHYFDAPEFAYDEYGDYGPEDFPEVYNGEAYDGAGGGRWLAYKHTLPSAMDRARCRTSPYARPK
ncbi:KH domain-containing, RNA-binding, signal transduction-associated protein 2-like [Portunus trituberculatus]|uniref:KH domain-containing, RNA-binding, signal transduction-associated protein 2-like n=1 Tax=Portunus trituberculatus TaxID=210409 RepID=UPI001E1CDEB9|nr:KH domain-containing, RNA-binding, signal transduction-associated protein 2-like [Portunus trituberculatus]